MIVTVDEVKTHLRIQHDEEDAYLTGLIVQAQAAAEEVTLPDAVATARLLMAQGTPPTAAAKQAAKGTPFSKGDIYKELIAAKDEDDREEESE